MVKQGRSLGRTTGLRRLLPLPLALAIFFLTAGTAWAAISIQNQKGEPLDGTVSNAPTRFQPAELNDRACAESCAGCRRAPPGRTPATR